MNRIASLLVAGLLVIGMSLPAVAQTTQKSTEETLFDFEPGGKLAFEQAKDCNFVTEHATRGKHSAKQELKDKGFGLSFGMNSNYNLGGRWQEFDRLVIDVFVEGGAVKFSGFIRDDEAKDWSSRYNFEQVLQPGKRTIEIPMGSITREAGGKPLNLAKLQWLAMDISSAAPAAPATIYLGNARLVKGTGSFEVLPLFSFEGADKGKYVLEDYPDEFKGKSKVSIVADHATDGKKAMLLESNAPAGNVQFSPEFQTWGDYDTLAVDVFNPNSAPLNISGWIKEKPDDSYDKRYTWERVIRPGASTVRLPVGGMVAGNGKVFAPEKVTVFNIATANSKLYIDNIRLIKGTEEVAVEGIRKFDFGPKSQAVMPGFTAVNRESAYDKAKGFGWSKDSQLQRDFDIREVLNRHRPYDDLVRDFSNPLKATFQVDVPNGEYGVWIMTAPPGAMVWHKTLKHYTVSVQGKVALDHDLRDPAKLNEWLFQWQDTEDLPGDDLWERYVNVAYKPIIATAEVKDGQLKLDFDTHGEAFSCMLCGVVVWPKSQEQQAQKWLSNLNATRKEQFLAVHVEQLPPAPKDVKIDEAAKAAGFVRFIHSPDRDVAVNTFPTDVEITAKGMDLAASPGEYEDGCFGLYPLKDCGLVKLQVEALKGPAGSTIGGDALDLQVSRYKAMNHNATYGIEPKYLDKAPAAGINIGKGVTRSFWLIVHVPADAKPGDYAGAVKLTLADGKTHEVPVKLTVWPIKLLDGELPMGMFGMAPPGEMASADPEKARWDGWKNVLEDARAHGMTSLDPGISMPLKAIKDGKAVIDFSEMDKFMELAKAAGFKQEINGYAIGVGFPLYVCDMDAVAKQFGVASYEQVVKAYFDAYREHAKAFPNGGYLPICFCSDDEYITHSGDQKKMAEHHAALRKAAPDIHIVDYDTMYVDTKPELMDSYKQIMQTVDTWGAGVHSPAMEKLVGDAGKRLWLYNTGANRFVFGSYMFFASKKHNVKGFFQWVYNGGGTLTNYDLCSHNESDYGVVYPSTRGLRATYKWERIRAGCNDHRYLQTAWQAIADAKASGKNLDAAKALEATINDLFAKLTFGKVRDVDAISGEGKADSPFTPAGMEALRRAIAEGIIKVQAGQ